MQTFKEHKEKPKQCLIRLTVELKETLDQHAKQSGSCTASLIRHALEQGLEAYVKPSFRRIPGKRLAAMKTSEYQPTTVYLVPTIKAKIESKSQMLGMKQSALVREVLKQYLRENS
jgi:predicted DNA-binding protein